MIKNMVSTIIRVFFLKCLNSFAESGFSSVSSGDNPKIIVVETAVNIKSRNILELYVFKILINAIDVNIDKVDII